MNKETIPRVTRHIDISGKVFGDLTVLHRVFVEGKKNRGACFLCRCSCGKETIARSDQLKCGNVSSCGCRHFHDLTGKKFGTLTVVRRAGDAECGRTRWECLCDCGKTKAVIAESLTTGRTKSCGCTRYVNMKRRYKEIGCLAHDSRICNIYHGIIKRCTNTNHISYKHYGGRGISICKEWRQDFLSFYRWAIAHGYNDTLTIDRIDVDGDYCPDNCRWATRKEQALNKQRHKEKQVA